MIRDSFNIHSQIYFYFMDILIPLNSDFQACNFTKTRTPLEVFIIYMDIVLNCS